MSIKITSRFAPSIIRAADALEALIAVNASQKGSKHVDGNGLQGSFMRLIEDYRRFTSGYQPIATKVSTGELVDQCMKERRMERVRLAKARATRREQARREREELAFA